VQDLEALRTEIALIRTHELDCMTRNCFEILEEDVGKFLIVTHVAKLSEGPPF
jgi:hypothetical protein